VTTPSFALYECKELPASTVTREAMSTPLAGWRTDYDPTTDQFAVVQIETGTTHLYERVI
jgi:hypothetical protein